MSSPDLPKMMNFAAKTKMTILEYIADFVSDVETIQQTQVSW